MNAPLPDLIKQHLIDPEICIRCNTCEETCPRDAITHDDRNYVVDASKCGACMDCVAPCPTGAIDNWRNVARALAYSTAEQLTWDVLPAPDERSGDAAGAPSPTGIGASSSAGLDASAAAAFASVAVRAGASPVAAPDEATGIADAAADSPGATEMFDRAPGAVIPPWSASHPYVNLYSPREPITATVTGNYRVTDSATESDTHHIVLDFGATPLPVLEGQSIGIVPPGVDARGRPHFPRQYSIASPRDGERAGYNNVALTVKRVTADRDGKAFRGVCSNYLCDLAKGATVQVIGPFGNSFLMPNHPGANLIMICTGTGSAPMRAMTERRRRRRAQGEGGRLMLFFGARSEQELPYFGPLMNLPGDFIDVNLAYSRTPGRPKRYVQDLMRERRADVAALLRDANTYIYVCGLKGMEAGVLEALGDIARAADLDWPQVWRELKARGRLHFETY
jgi:benzoyl-CoA oxygenase/reductase BoxA protein